MIEYNFPVNYGYGWTWVKHQSVSGNKYRALMEFYVIMSIQEKTIRAHDMGQCWSRYL